MICTARGLVFVALVLAFYPVWAQEESPRLIRLAPGLFSLHGLEPGSGTEYVRLFLLADSEANSSSESTPGFSYFHDRMHAAAQSARDLFLCELRRG